MTRPIVFVPEARVELIEAQDWYESRRMGWARCFGAKSPEQSNVSLRARCISRR